MRTPGEILVQTAFRLYHNQPSELQAYLVKRIDILLSKRIVDIGQSDIEGIIMQVCEICGANPVTIKSKYRGREHVEARAILYKVLTSRSLFDWPLKKTGIFFGGRDHSTVINGLKNYNDWTESDRTFRKKAEICIGIAHKILHEQDESENPENMAV